MFLFIVGMAAAACESSVGPDLLASAEARAQLAMSSFDPDGFAAAVMEARAALPCLGSPLTALDAAGYHGLEGLAAFAEGRTEDARASFASAFAAMPEYRLPKVIVPPEGDLDLLLAAARALPAGESEALPPYDGVLVVDGTRAFARPLWRPCVLQLVGSDGRARETHYLRGSDSLPPWDPPPTLVTRLLPETRERPSARFALAAGGAALAAGGLYALGGLARAEFDDETTPYERLPALQDRTNLALGGVIALGATTAALTTLTFLEW